MKDEDLRLLQETYSNLVDAHWALRRHDLSDHEQHFAHKIVNFCHIMVEWYAEKYDVDLERSTETKSIGEIIEEMREQGRL